MCFQWKVLKNSSHYIGKKSNELEQSKVLGVSKNDGMIICDPSADILVGKTKNIHSHSRVLYIFIWKSTTSIVHFLYDYRHKLLYNANFKIMCEPVQEYLQESSTGKQEQNIPRGWKFLQKLWLLFCRRISQMPVLQGNGKAFDSEQKRPGHGAEDVMKYFVFVLEILQIQQAN